VVSISLIVINTERQVGKKTPRHNIGDTGVQFPWQQNHTSPRLA